MFSKPKKKFKGLISQLNDVDLFEKISLYKGEKSYTINKQKVFLCLKDEKGEYYDDMMLIYVLLHEISHVLCDEVGHTQKFNDIFDEILEEATKHGIFDPSYPILQNYCQY
jgi:hypothetical protein